MSIFHNKACQGPGLGFALVFAVCANAFAQPAVAIGGSSVSATTSTSSSRGVIGAATGGLAMTPTLGAAAGQVGSGKAASPANSAREDEKSATKPEAQRVQGEGGADEPSQFQRFVQESTGRLLPLHGQSLFDAPQAYSADANMPVPDHYILGPGDEVRLKVWGSVDIEASLTLDRNGQVAVPRVGVVMLAGVAVRDLEKTLQAQLSRVLTNFQASATLNRLRGIQIYVVGQARQPGTFQLSSLSTLVNALFASGGPTANGSMRRIELKRAGKTISTFDVYDFIARGDKSKDVALLSGDVIVIPSVGPRVAVTGAFDHAAIYELKNGSNSVNDILSLSGGVPTLANTRKALLERISRSSEPPRQVQEIALDASGLVEPLQDGDVLTLLGISPAFANAVTLQGTVAAPLRYRWFEGMTLFDLIPERDALITSDFYKRQNLLVQNIEAAQSAGTNITDRVRGMVDQINWEYAVIERMDRSQLSTRLIPFNLGKVVIHKDPKHNLQLFPGDVVTILNQSDLRLPQARVTRLVRVEGEVAAPGVYQTLPGETLPQLLQRVGGLTSQAYLFGTEFNRESIRTRQQENLNTVIRRLESQSLSRGATVAATTAANATGERGAAQLQGLQQAQQAQLDAQLDRLRNLQSNGRLSLELDTKAVDLSSLPGIPLEDGDSIHVPATPGFVAAVGSVNNENAIIYKLGKTVGDVIKSAGMTEDAELSQAFVVRADGSLIARRSTGFLGGSFESVKIMPGDTLVVPAQIDRESRYSAIVRGFKDWTSIFSNFGLGVLALSQLGKL